MRLNVGCAMLGVGLCCEVNKKPWKVMWGVEGGPLCQFERWLRGEGGGGQGV